MYQTLLNAELAMLDSLDPIRCSAIDYIMIFFTSLANGGAVWIILAIMLLLFKKTRVIGVCVSIALIMDLVVVNLFLKPVIARVRPYDIAQGISLIISKPSDFSFPSGHTAASFSAAVSVFMFNKKWGRVCIVLASLIAFSRLYLYVHFPTDVAAGVIIGTIFAMFSYFLCKKTSLKTYF